MTLPRVGLVDAVLDKDLLGATVESWPRQREILAGIEAGPRMHVLCLGRRSGKTMMAAAVALWDACLRPELATTQRAGEYRHAVCVATNRRQAAIFLDACRSMIEASPLLAELLERETADELVFSTGCKVAAFPCTSRGARGWAISTLVLDEFAHHVPDELEGPQSASRLLDALLPATATFGRDARIVIASTPFGTDTAFHDLHVRASSGELQGARAYHFPTSEMNPTIPSEFLEEERARDPEGFTQEYEAIPGAGGGQFIDGELIDGAVADRMELEPDHAKGWVAGFDAGFARDPSALCIVGSDPLDQRVLKLGLARRWMPQRHSGSFEERREIEDRTLDEVAAVIRSYNATAVVDQHLSRAIHDYLSSRGIRTKVRPITAATKTEMFVSVRSRLALNALELYPDAQLLAELPRLRTRYAAGSSSVLTPRAGGSHCDLAVALALATHEHSRFGLGGETYFPDRDENAPAPLTAGVLEMRF